jgi:hypothetical protein
MTARDQFAAMTPEDIILLVAADTLLWRLPETRPSIRGYEAEWSLSGHWNHTNWRECISSALRAISTQHGHHFQAAAMRRKLQIRG